MKSPGDEREFLISGVALTAFLNKLLKPGAFSDVPSSPGRCEEVAGRRIQRPDRRLARRAPRVLRAGRHRPPAPRSKGASVVRYSLERDPLADPEPAPRVAVARRRAWSKPARQD